MAEKGMPMNPRQLVHDIIARRPAPRPGFWIGKPSEAMQRQLNEHFGTHTLSEVYDRLGDDIRWITPQYVKSTYRHPDGKSMRPWKEQNPHGLSGGPLSQAETAHEVEAFDWPDPRYLDFSESLAHLRAVGPHYRLSGFWTPFFHDLTYLVGTENLLLMMCLNPTVVHAMLDHVGTFYLEANERFYTEARGLVDGFFFGNDFGTQSDLLMAPEQFEVFFLPWIARFCEQAHRHNIQTVLHSCGAIARVIDQLADAGVDCIHPLQARASGMDAGSLQRFRGRIAFMGGIDTQDLLVNAAPDRVREEVRRVVSVVGPHIIIGPSHEAMLPGIPVANIIAMAEEIVSWQ
jgi:uroporphyrinogen decarboxylase